MSALITAAQAAERLSVSVDTVLRLVKAGHISSFIVGRRHKLRLEDINAYVESRRSN